MLGVLLSYTGPQSGKHCSSREPTEILSGKGVRPGARMRPVCFAMEVLCQVGHVAPPAPTPPRGTVTSIAQEGTAYRCGMV